MHKRLLKRKQRKMKQSHSNDEQTFIEHLEALRSMLIHSLSAVALLSLPGFYLAPECIDFLIKNSLPENIGKLHYFSPMEVFIIQLKAGVVLGFIIAFPYIVYQVRKFVLPALFSIIFYLSAGSYSRTGKFYKLISSNDSRFRANVSVSAWSSYMCKIWSGQCKYAKKCPTIYYSRDSYTCCNFYSAGHSKPAYARRSYLVIV